MKNAIVILFLFLLSFSAISQHTLKGKVVDNETGSPLPFVSIVYNEQGQGLTTGLDGDFEISTLQQIKELKFSYLGYSKYTQFITPKDYKSSINIGLSPYAYELDKVIIRPGVNPSHRIINKVVKNSGTNNPETLPHFRYNSYNKMYFTFRRDTSNLDKSEIISDADSVSSEPVDSLIQRIDSFKKRQHVFLMESVTERNYGGPGKNNEKVLATRVSGLKDPFLVFVATQFQSFSFYSELINLGGKNYLNPISKGSTNRYLFILEDTLFTQTFDTLFVISFRPLLNKNFAALKGVMNINSNGYAIQNVIAEPVDPPSPLFTLKIQQRYDFIDSTQWFPVELNTDLYLTRSNVEPKDSTLGTRSSISMIGVGNSYIKNIDLNPQQQAKQFSHVELTFDPLSCERDEKFWMQFRSDSLSSQDIKTYEVIDSIGNKINLDKRMRFVETMITGRIPVGYFNIDVNRLLAYNRFEGYRLGLGLETSQKLIKWLTIGGYYAYGFKDEEHKYGGFSRLYLNRRHHISLEGGYEHDVREPGEFRFKKPFGLINTDYFRDVLIWKMDYVDSYTARFNFRVLKNFTVGLIANQMQFNTASDYEVNLPNLNTPNEFTTNELGAEVKFVWKETFMETPRGLLPLGFGYPMIWLNYSQGIPNYGGQFSYNRFEVRFDHQVLYRTIGKTSISLSGGMLNGDIPTSLLQFTPGSNGKYPLDATNSFAAMYLYEFVSDKYAYVFIRHNFETLFWKTKSKIFKPQFALVQNMAIGNYSQKSIHLFPVIPPKTLNKGYFESGFLVNGILSNPFYSLGVGAYYRWGSYAYPSWQDNFALKLTLTTNF